VEWVGLVLGLALALGGGAVATGGADFRGEADELGEAVAQRVTCAAREACARGAGSFDRAPGGGAVPPHRTASGPAPGAGAPSQRRPSTPPASQRVPNRAEAGAGGKALRAFDKFGRYASVACLGYRRFQYDLEHPRTPRQGIPIGDTLGIVNSCLNPLGFLFP